MYRERRTLSRLLMILYSDVMCDADTDDDLHVHSLH